MQFQLVVKAPSAGRVEKNLSGLRARVAATPSRAAVLLVSLVATMRLGSSMWVLERLVTLVNKPLADYSAAEG